MSPIDLRTQNVEEYWRRPQFSDQGDAEASSVFESVGFALSAWEGMEGSFANLFTFLLEGFSGAATRAYGSVMSNSGRRDMLNAAAPIFFDRRNVKTETQNDFKKAIEHFANASGKRNEIAHGIVTALTLNGNPRGMFLIPPSYNSGKTEPMLLKDIGKPAKDEFEILRVTYRYTSANILVYAEKFGALGRTTNLLLSDLWEYLPASRG